MPDTLLLADDSATIHRVIEMTFAEEDVRVVSVGDGREAIERIAADPPDIVLADTNMPEKDGYDVSAFVKADSALSHIPVVLLTGAFDPVDDERAREVGCDAVLVKPFEPTAVINRVRELLGVPAAPATSVPAAAASAPATAASTPDAAPDPAAGDDARAPAGGDAAQDAAAPSVPPTPGGPAFDPRLDGAVPSSPSPSASSRLSADVEPTRSAPAPDGMQEAGRDDSATGPDSAPAASAPAESPAADANAGDASPAVPAVPAVEAPALPSLADAFASLLAAEQGDPARARAAYPWPRQAAAGEDALVERVTERVVERLSSEVTGELVSEVVARVAERLVRDQIGRIETA